MLRKLVKKSILLFLITTIIVQGVNPFAFVEIGKTIIEHYKQANIVDKIYLAKLNKNVVDTFSSTSHTAHAAINPNEREYVVDIGPVNGSTAANYVYATFFNPSGSGRTASIKRIAIRSNTIGTASNYVNLTLRRISAASAGTQITQANIPKKNASSSDTVMEVRHTTVTATFSGVTNSRILGRPLSGAIGAYYPGRDLSFGDNDEKIVIQPGEGIGLYQEAAGTVNSRVRILIEWDETTNPPSAGNEYLFAFPRVENAAGANYVYNSFFNPAASGKSAVIKRIWFGAETCDGAAVYTNDIVLKRTSAASAGTQVTSSDVPKKNTSSANSAMEFRHTNVTVTQVGGTDMRLGNITPCGAAGQAGGWQELNFESGDEKLILKQGEGIALLSEAAGNANQIVRMVIEWQEVDIASIPSAQGEYIWASSRVAAAAAANTTYYSFFNPSGSGKNAIIKRLVIRANADAAANYIAFSFRRVSAASAGNLIATSSIAKKHTDSATSSMEVRWCGATCATAITATYSGTVDSNLMSVNGPGAIGQIIGQREIVFGDEEKIILQPGEGIGLYNSALADANQIVKILIEWDEENSAPSSEGQYLIDIGPINGNVGATYNYATFFNPAASGKTAIVKRVSIRVDAANAALYIPMQLRRISAASLGTQITAANIPKKHTGTANSIMEIRRTGVTATLSGTADSRLVAIQTPGAVSSVTSGNTGYREVVFTTQEEIILQPGEGLCLYQDAAGDVDFRVKLLIEWDEETSAPASLGEYLVTTGPITQSLAANYVYTTLFNPASSGKNYIVKRLGIQSDRSGAAVAPTYLPVTVRKVSAASAGTLIGVANIPKKHSSTANTSAELRTTGVTATLSGVTDSRIISTMIPGAVNQPFGDFESIVTYGDELILQPGEGVALYQEQANGDALVRHRFLVEWDEENTGNLPQALTFAISTSTIYLGQASPVIPRYASSTNTAGSDTEVEAHTLSVLTNATNGYTVTVRGQTLTSGTTTISAIGGTNTASVPGTEQFGIRLVASGGSGAVTVPYAASGFAYSATATTSAQVASASLGDNATTTYSVRYLVNISATTSPKFYTTDLVYIATANF